GRRLQQPEIRRMFFHVLPVAALAAAGTSELDDERLGWLDELGRVDPPRLAQALSDANRFARADQVAGVPLPRAARAALITEIGWTSATRMWKRSCECPVNRGARSRLAWACPKRPRCRS